MTEARKEIIQDLILQSKLIMNKESRAIRGISSFLHDHCKWTDLIKNVCSPNSLSTIIKFGNKSYRTNEEKCLEFNVAQLNKEHICSKNGLAKKIRKVCLSKEPDEEEIYRLILLYGIMIYLTEKENQALGSKSYQSIDDIVQSYSTENILELVEFEEIKNGRNKEYRELKRWSVKEYLEHILNSK